MTSALLAGLTGLRANQDYLNVIGNNLANSNTTGYKSSRVTFSDILSQTLRPASGPSASLGGSNPVQVGRGAQIASVDQNFAQGSLLNTGRNLDLGIQGNGFFVLSDGSNTYFTRVGTFGIDSSENLVDSTSGLRVQSAAGSDIKIQLNSVVPPVETSDVSFRGNLPAVGPDSGPSTELWQSEKYLEVSPAKVPGSVTTLGTISAADRLIIQVGTAATQVITVQTADLPNLTTMNGMVNFLNQKLNGATASLVNGAITITSNAKGTGARIQISNSEIATALGLSTTAFTGGEAPATAATPLNLLKNNLTNYTNGDHVRVYGSKGNAVNVDSDFVYGTDGTTLGELVNFTNALYQPEATLALGTNGSLSLTAANPGSTALSLTFLDRAISTGKSNFSLNALNETTTGRDADVASTVSTVYDSLGGVHQISFKFARQLDGSWSVTASVDPAEGTLASTNIATLTFDSHGQLPAALTSTLDITWQGGAAPQTVTLDIGGAAGSVGLTQFGGRKEVFSDANGAPAGTLSSISIESDGRITGRYSNGQSRDVNQLQMALFTNPAGLERAGNGHFVASSNSGNPQLTTAGNGASGSILSGSLEGSNVDTAEEFVRLIEAQRGFQANARVITTSDQVLAELVNLGR